MTKSRLIRTPRISWTQEQIKLLRAHYPHHRSADLVSIIGRSVNSIYDKVSDTGYKARDWVGAHVLLWREHHGEVPAGHAVVFKNGNKKNIAIENLELISRGELMKRNSIHSYPKEVVQLMQLRGALNRQIRRRTKDEQDDPASIPA